MVGTWCEYAHMHYLDCILLPDGVDPADYARLCGQYDHALCVPQAESTATPRT